MILFLKLAIGHYLADYPLQGDFLAKAKNHRQPIPGVPWYQALFAHSAIQAGMVWYLTGKLWLACVEFQLHAFIDWLKSNENISFDQDQIAHLACKALYVFVLTYDIL